MNKDTMTFSFTDDDLNLSNTKLDFTIDEQVEKALEILEALENQKAVERVSGWVRWFVPGTPYGIENLPKHKAFFSASKDYQETYFSAANRCLAEGTLVATPKGPVAIEDIRIGDTVYDRHGNETTVVNWFDNGEREVVDLVNRGKVYVTCTPDHEFDAIFLKKGSTVENGLFSEKRIKAEDLKKGRLVKRSSVSAPLGYTNEKWAYALGALLGDGCGTEGTRNRIVISSACNKIPERVGSEIGATGVQKLHKDNYNWSLNIQAPDISDLYYRWCYNRKAHEKNVEIAVIKTWSRESVLRFVAGLIDTDGGLSVGRDGHSLCLTSQSHAILAAYSYCVLALWNEKVSISQDSRGKYVNGPCYTAIVRNPHKLRIICEELKPYLCHQYKATLNEKVIGGKRSHKDYIYLTPDWSSLRIARVYDITVSNDDHFFLLANGVSTSNCGKTISGAFQTACHLLGEYPSWWPGRKFDKPTDGWAVGDNKETVRDIITKELLGDVGKIGTGMIPADRIEKVVYRPNSGGAVDYVLVKHASGGTSRLGFKSSEQGIVSFYGTQKDFIWLDELPPADIYSECYLRTMTTNGIMYVTATPLAGLTPLVLSFYNNADFLPRGSEVPGIVRLSREDENEKALEALRRGEIDQIKKSDNVSKAVIVAGWDDAVWLTEDAKRRMLDATPPHLKEARSKGLPSMGSGTIYTIPLEEILVKDFDIPAHWKKVAGMDVGWSATACIWLAQNPDTKEVVVYSEYKRGQAEPLIHASAVKGRGDWIPVAIDPASRGRSQVDGRQLFNLYRELGVKLFAADNAVEAGIYQIQEMLATGRLKFFRSLSELAKEYVVYRRDQKGRVVKENDHCLSGDTVVQTSKGNKKIKELVGTEGEIRTLTGDFVPYTNCRLTREMADLVEVTFEDGYRLVCTPDHKLLTENRWVEAIDSLRYAVYTMGTTPVQPPEVQNVCNQQSIVSTQPSKSSLESVTTCAVTTSSETVFDSIASCGHTSTEKSLKDTTFITKTMTKPTTLQKIWSWFTGLSTCLTTTQATTEDRLNTPMSWLRSGINRKKVETGISSTISTTETNCTSGSNEPVLTVENPTKQRVSELKRLSAPTNASPLTGELLGQTTLKGSASSAIRLFPLTDIQSKSLARESAERKLVSVKSVNVLNRKEDVYCLEVPDYACFVVENGVVVHNCLDALRYAVMALKHARSQPIPTNNYHGGSTNYGSRSYDC